MTLGMLPWIRICVRVLVVVVLAYAGLGLMVYFMQAGMVYYPSRHVTMRPDFLGMKYEEVALRSANDEKIVGWFVPCEGARWTALFFHGNGGNMGGRVEILKGFHDIGLAVLIIDYQGYGESGGRPSEQGTYEDALAAWDYLVKERGLSAKSIVVHGRSLGGAVATWLACEQEPGALVVESTFTSIMDMAARRFPYLPVRPLCRFSYDTVGNIARVKCPVLVAHSPEDEVVPYEHGKLLFAAAGQPKQFVELSGSHNVGSVDANEAYGQALGDFLKKHTTLSPR